MHTYAILKNPGYTRVSFQDSDILATNELTLAALSVENMRHENIGGIPYLLFDRDMSLNENEFIMLSRLSFTYALFEMTKDKLLRPITLTPNYFLNQELSAILKYSGKTNELFTRLMLNLAQFHIKNPVSHLNILDPLAGKGTTLYESLMQNHNAYGIEIEQNPPKESQTYLKKYLETARYKHTSHTEKISGTSSFGKFTATRYQLEISRNKAEERQGDLRQFEIISGDTRATAHFFKKSYFHAIIADLPYGVQHGSKSGSEKRPKSITRNAMGLISEAMPGWIKCLKPGGVVVLAWNLFLIPRDDMIKLLIENGLKISEAASMLTFAHRVDQAIDRDVIIGMKS